MIKNGFVISVSMKVNMYELDVTAFVLEKSVLFKWNIILTKRSILDRLKKRTIMNRPICIGRKMRDECEI